ncbi:hypothetical protein [Kribbella flavida]|nr:hypothetical protein [Kribbella flavida]
MPASSWASAPSTAGSVPTDSRVTAAVAAWKHDPVYFDPQYAASVAEHVTALRDRIAQSPVPVYLAAVPTGAWFPEKGDTELLAGWMAAANGKPGLYVVMFGTETVGVEHLVQAYSPGRVYAASRKSVADRLAEFLDAVKVSDRYDAKPARTQPLPPRDATPREPERFTAGQAIASGIGGAVLGLLGGAVLAGIVLGVAALVARRGGGRL